MLVHRKLWKEYFVACNNESCQAKVGFLAGRQVEHLIHRTPESAAAAWNTTHRRLLVEAIKRDV